MSRLFLPRERLLEARDLDRKLRESGHRPGGWVLRGPLKKDLERGEEKYLRLTSGCTLCRKTHSLYIPLGSGSVEKVGKGWAEPCAPCHPWRELRAANVRTGQGLAYSLSLSRRFGTLDENLGRAADDARSKGHILAPWGFPAPHLLVASTYCLVCETSLVIEERDASSPRIPFRGAALKLPCLLDRQEQAQLTVVTGGLDVTDQRPILEKAA